ncbi:protein kinase domain-containing protein [Legionella hackeliae]|uniref:Serine/threonine-protein kinase n=1 Tax=Legionella hackeliae TaxID=449 RepID=A0A0A8UNU1_LEGHA|nr:protein kinase [Legionella hackeliae]KTD12842.1 putative protein kinase [Legionella hackeliae]CEK09146.1 Serine/threonine-protein kinase [Legionella hackeliae]STX49056.1 Serine/threonine protein kinase [Legionella hackeliae]
MKKKLINPANPKKKHRPLLRALLEQTSDSTQGWQEATYYQITYKKKKIKVALTSTVIQRESKNGGARYEAIDSTPLGKGSFGVVYPINATIRMTHDDVLIKHKPYGKRRIAKQRPHTYRTMDDAVKEYNLTEKTPHSHAKYPVTFNHHIYSVSRRMEGRELFDILNDDLTGVRKLTIKERLMLSKSLIEALQTQVFDAGLVHRDLKPENIIVDVMQNLVGTIDFGLAKLNDAEMLNDSVGSMSYVSPEVLLDLGTTQQSDIYGMGRILALLWRVNLDSYDPDIKSLERLKMAEKNDYSGLFQGIKGEINPKAARIIKEIIHQMTAFKPLNRGSLNEVFDLFNTAEKLQFPEQVTSIFKTNPEGEHNNNSHKKVTNLKAEKSLSLEDAPVIKPKKKKWGGFFFKSSKKEEAPVMKPEKGPGPPTDRF